MDAQATTGRLASIPRWRQATLHCADTHAVQRVITILGRRLAEAENHQRIAAWWFIRKAEKLRVRVQIVPPHVQIGALLSDVVVLSSVRRWAFQIYEPEIQAFGGVQAMDAVHALFHADSRRLLDYLHTAEKPDRRRELALILAGTLLRGAHLDWYEQGDVWARLAGHRFISAELPEPGSPPAARIQTLITATEHHMHSPLHMAPSWGEAYERAGHQLAALFEQGGLTRGLRAVLAHVVLFCWNRIGIPAAEQGLYAATAARLIFGGIPPVNLRLGDQASATLCAVTTNTDTAIPSPEQLRAALVAHIQGRGTFANDRIRAAFAAVPRHLFLPGVSLEEAYKPQVVRTKHADSGVTISSASHPDMVAAMLGQLDPRPGQQIMEIGAGTGINAALLAELVGDGVVTIDIDDDIVAQARGHLTAAGYANVRTVCRDGAEGHPERSPYDGIIVTTGAWDIPAPWWEQLAPGGRIVVPLQLHESGLTRSIALDMNDRGHLVSHGRALVCGFVSMRGSSATTDQTVRLADDVTFQLGGQAAGETLAHALSHPAHSTWTGIHIGDRQPVEHLDLWLVTSGATFGRLHAGPQARRTGLATPALRWAGAALYTADTLAYLALRPVEPGVNEIGVTAHGPDADQLSAHLIALLHRWDGLRPEQPTVTTYPAGTPDRDLARGHVIDRPDSRLTISW